MNSVVSLQHYQVNSVQHLSVTDLKYISSKLIDHKNHSILVL